MMAKFKKEILNFSVLLYFVFMILTNQIENYAVFVGFYASLVLCGVIGLYTNNFHLSVNKILVILLLIATALINLVIVGNATLKHVIYIGLFSFASLSLISKELHEKTLLIAFVLNAIVIIYKLAVFGPFSDQLFTSSTRNFVSVYLMFPLVIYYTVIAKKNKEISLIPIVITWIICLYARGRGGIICSTILLVGICFVKYKKMKSAKKAIISLILIILIILIIPNFAILLEKIESFSFMELFARNQMESSRLRFWPEYIELATSNTRNILFGANISDIYIGQHLDGNPHNSFIEMHMINGLIGLFVIFLLLIKRGIQSIKSKNYLFLFCMLSLLLRAFTDHVLWAAFGTPILFYFLFYFNAETSYYRK